MDFVRYLLWICIVGLVYWQVNADPVEDKKTLLDFVNNLHHSRPLNWNWNSDVCNVWTGVTCNEDGSRVLAVRLPGVGLQGPIPPNTLGRLSALQALSLRSNDITGDFPADLLNLKNLSLLYLQFNNFSGPLPSDFTVWKNLTVVNLSNNRFSGSIPQSLLHLTELTTLNLANNLLSGEIPDLEFPRLQHLNLSSNNLSGSVSQSLLKFPRSAFTGNNVTFESAPQLFPAVAPSSSVPRSKSKNTRRMGLVALLVIIGAIILCVAVIAFMMYVCCSKSKSGDGFSVTLQKGQMSPEKVVSRSQDANNRLVFFGGCSYAFDLEDLLRASAEVVGKGTFGMAYKAILEDAATVVVKRLKEVAVGKKDFEQHMEIIGNIKHENVVELKAYYYSKDEKLMVYDYHAQGSLSSILHGKREDRVPLDWDLRLRIALGAARGIACIHAAHGGKLVHGNIKSSNIFLNSQQFGCVSDLGLANIMCSLAPPISRAAGYRAPEVIDTRKPAQPSDVYSFGVVLLELLTGKSPIHTIGGDEIIHLVRWVHSVVREEWTAEVFDLELMRYPNIEEEMVEMLQIAMSCVARVAAQRPKMSEVVKMIENVRPIDESNRGSMENQSGSLTPSALRTETENQSH